MFNHAIEPENLAVWRSIFTTAKLNYDSYSHMYIYEFHQYFCNIDLGPKRHTYKCNSHQCFHIIVVQLHMYLTNNLKKSHDSIEQLRVTSPIETTTKFISAWQDRQDQASWYKCVPLSSHGVRSSRISVWMDASPLAFFCHYVSLWKNAQWALQSER